MLAAAMGCSSDDPVNGPVLTDSASVILLHHSTGANIWAGGVPEAIAAYNDGHGTSYGIVELAYPSSGGYGWADYPFDYWNIWVNHTDDDPYLTEPAERAFEFEVRGTARGRGEHPRPRGERRVRWTACRGRRRRRWWS